ncbi:MAG: hypothetical protein K1Y36_01755 [Blastocatellia bacterium]|nr:hypothetical protein [Blastocatellia bacterium]
MIRIVKPGRSPEILTAKGRRRTQTYIRKFNQSPQEYSQGQKTFFFDNEIYGHPSVKVELRLAQHEKCCFCESIIAEAGDVEHFRPKGGYRQDETDDLHQPGYFWLAYEWSNLFLACSTCNSRHKKNLFPLQNPKQRVTTPCSQKALQQEEPLFINPAEVDPANYISFRGWIPFAIADNALGKMTISALGLDRESLNLRRESRFGFLKQLFEILHSSCPEELKQRVQDKINRELQDSAEFAAMARIAIKTSFQE